VERAEFLEKYFRFHPSDSFGSNKSTRGRRPAIGP
jgi:hypothetical protein